MGCFFILCLPRPYLSLSFYFGVLFLDFLYHTSNLCSQSISVLVTLILNYTVDHLWFLFIFLCMFISWLLLFYILATSCISWLHLVYLGYIFYILASSFIYWLRLLYLGYIFYILASSFIYWLHLLYLGYIFYIFTFCCYPHNYNNYSVTGEL